MALSLTYNYRDTYLQEHTNTLDFHDETKNIHKYL